MGEQWVEHRSIGELHRTDLNMKKKEKRKRSSKEQEAEKKQFLFLCRTARRGTQDPSSQKEKEWKKRKGNRRNTCTGLLWKGLDKEKEN